MLASWIAQILFKLLGIYMDRYVQSKEAKESFIQFIEAFNRTKITVIKYRLDSVDDIEAAKTKWKSEDANPPV